MLFFASLGVLITGAFSARILVIVPTPCYSHQIVFQALEKELLKNRHELTVLTTHPLSDPSLANLTEIDLSSTCDEWRNLNFIEISKCSGFQQFQTVLQIVSACAERLISLPGMQNLLQNGHFDLLIAESIFPTLFALARKFNCPFIAMSSLEAASRNYNFVGNPSHPVLNPSFLLPFVGKLTFWQRVKSVTFEVVAMWMNYYYVLPSQDLLIKRHFGEDYPSVEMFAKNMSLLFINTDPIFHGVRPLLPAVIQIGGGIHLQPPQKLPQDMEDILNNATEGCIYFSLGSTIKSNHLPNETLQIFLNAFSEISLTVLLKHDDALMEKPNNVFISKWFPQQDILRHRNVKLFISTGGLQSVEEAIHYNVPILGLPIIGDEFININRLVHKGMGLSLDFENLSKEFIKQTILEMVNDQRERTKMMADLIKDTPMTGLERAVWWTEYILRHRGSEHLKSDAVDLPTYQYFLLDVLLFYLLPILIGVMSIRFLTGMLRN